MSDTVLILRTCAANLDCCASPGENSHAAFRWPASGPVECPDWDPAPTCGGGLHGLLWGEGSAARLSSDADARWLVVRALAADVVLIPDDAGKCKIPRGEVVFCGDVKGATDYLLAHGAQGRAVVHSTVTGGDDSTVTGGYASTVTGGADSTVTGGACSKVTGGDDSTVTGGADSTVTGGARSKVTGGARSKVTGGDASTVTGGYASMVTGGACSKVTGGDDSTVTGGYASILQLRWWDGRRYRIATFYVGEDGIKAGVAYRCDGGKPVRVVAKESP